MQRSNTATYATGFSLVELMIVLVVIAILASIAYPSYRSFIVRGNQAGAQEFMLKVADQANQYRLDARNYPTALGQGAGEIDLTVPEAVSNTYAVTLTRSAGPPQSLSIQATPKSGTIQADAATLTLTSAGKKTPAEVWK